jgi:hypothetical protein
VSEEGQRPFFLFSSKELTKELKINPLPALDPAIGKGIGWYSRAENPVRPFLGLIDFLTFYFVIFLLPWAWLPCFLS